MHPDKRTTFTETNSFESHYLEFFFPKNYPALSFQNFLRKLVQYPIIFKDRFSNTRLKVILNHTILDTPKTNIVLIVDESVVSTHLDINGYVRETVPASLKNLSNLGMLKNWGTSASATTTSIYSNRLLLTGVPIRKYEDLDLANQYPTIFQYAKARGYMTHYYDAQLDYFWSGKPEDVFWIDEYLSSNFFLKQITAYYEIDRAIARHLRKLLSSGNNHFVVVNKAGVHAPYSMNYPQDNATWQPTPDSKIVTVGSKEAISKEINNYDNALRYNFDTFWGELFSNPDDIKHLLDNTVFIYTSDHGQGVDYGIPHGGSTKAEASVPILIIGHLKEEVCCDVSFKASHENILPTILDLMSISDHDRSVSYSHSLLSAKASDSRPRSFIAVSKGLFKFD